MRWLFAAPFSGVRTSIFISTYYRSLARAAAADGIEVKLTDTKELIASQSIPAVMRKLYVPLAKIIDRFQLLSLTESGMRKQLIDDIKSYEPDVVFIYAINAQSLDTVIEQVRKYGCKIVMWLGLNPSVVSQSVQRMLQYLDCLFIYDPAYLTTCRQLGCRRVEVVPLGVDIDHIDSVPPPQASTDPVNLSFVGMIDAKRYELLSEIATLGLGVWSWNYSSDKYPLLKTCYHGEAAGDYAIRMLKSSMIGINMHRDFEISGGNYRLFEIPACKVFQLADDKPAISNFFNIGEEIITYNSSADLLKKAAYYLKNERERDEIVRLSYQKVKNVHTIQHRYKLMAEIIQTL